MFKFKQNKNNKREAEAASSLSALFSAFEESNNSKKFKHDELIENTIELFNELLRDSNFSEGFHLYFQANVSDKIIVFENAIRHLAAESHDLSSEDLLELVLEETGISSSLKRYYIQYTAKEILFNDFNDLLNDDYKHISPTEEGRLNFFSYFAMREILASPFMFNENSLDLVATRVSNYLHQRRYDNQLDRIITEAEACFSTHFIKEPHFHRTVGRFFQQNKEFQSSATGAYLRDGLSQFIRKFLTVDTLQHYTSEQLVELYLISCEQKINSADMQIPSVVSIAKI